MKRAVLILVAAIATGVIGGWAEFDQPFRANPGNPWTALPDGTINCLIVLPGPLAHSTGKDHAQIWMTNYPNKGDTLMMTCEAVADD